MNNHEDPESDTAGPTAGPAETTPVSITTPASTTIPTKPAFPAKSATSSLTSTPGRSSLPITPAAPAMPGKPAKAPKAASPGKPVKPRKFVGSGTKGKRRGGKVLAMLVAGVVLLGGGIWVGTALSDPTTSEEYAALDATARAAARDRDIIAADRKALSSGMVAAETAVKAREAAADAKATAADKREADLKVADAAMKKREEAVVGAEKKKAAGTIGDGTWVVGTDIEAGTYKAKADVGSKCYWGIFASGTNGSDIIANDLPGGGLPSVTLAAGQDFKSSRCGSWEKQ